METESLNRILEEDILSEESKKKLSLVYHDLCKKEFSDLLDDYGNQYIEFVQEGGGVWGSALVGYLYALEIFGIRFLKVAGTSAGAINTVLIAACKTKEEAKSEVIKDLLFNWDFSDFMDGKTYVKTIIHAMLSDKNFIRNNLISAGVIILIFVLAPFFTSFNSPLLIKLFFLLPFIPILIAYFCFMKFYKDFKTRNSGLNPGNTFLNKMKEVLDGFGIKTVADLQQRFIQKEHDLNLNYRYGNGSEYYDIALKGIEEIRMNNSEHIDKTRYRIFYESAVNNDYYKNNPFYLLKTEYIIITTDINAKIKVELPTMANLYWSEDELKKISPAEFVRASMSVPYFFEPMQKQINKEDASVKYAWRFWMNTKKEDIYPVGIFIDGGSISNFPIDLFHSNDIFYPRMPLFGVQLTSDAELLSAKGETSGEILKSPFSYTLNILGTLKGFNDKSFLTKYSFYNLHSIKTVNCGKSSWLNFFMKKDEKEQLFNAGFTAALDFLYQFDWQKYKCERMMVAMKDKKILKEEDTPTVG